MGVGRATEGGFSIKVPDFASSGPFRIPGGESEARRILTLAGLMPGEKVLDASLGTGVLSILLEKKCRISRLGGDWDLPPSVEAIAGTVEHVAAPDGSFGAIIQLGSVHLTQEIRRVVRTGGRVAVGGVVRRDAAAFRKDLPRLGYEPWWVEFASDEAASFYRAACRNPANAAVADVLEKEVVGPLEAGIAHYVRGVLSAR